MDCGLAGQRLNRLQRPHARRLVAVALVAGGWAAGCATPRAGVPLYGDPSELAGEWSGQYHSDESGRSGPIVFRLTAGQDTARGDVVMLVPRSAGEGLGIYPAGASASWPTSPAPDARVLTIRFVQVEAGRIRGRLDPYRDPSCGCAVETVFEGVQQGDVITGTFVARHLERAHTQHGRWHVRRD
jgi:hypothetical protein